MDEIQITQKAYEELLDKLFDEYPTEMANPHVVYIVGEAFIAGGKHTMERAQVALDEMYEGCDD